MVFKIQEVLIVLMISTEAYAIAGPTNPTVSSSSDGTPTTGTVVPSTTFAPGYTTGVPGNETTIATGNETTIAPGVTTGVPGLVTNFGYGITMMGVAGPATTVAAGVTMGVAGPATTVAAGVTMGVPGPATTVPAGITMGVPGPATTVPAGVTMGVPGPATTVPAGVTMGVPGPATTVPAGITMGATVPATAIPAVVTMGVPGPATTVAAGITMGATVPATAVPAGVTMGVPGPATTVAAGITMGATVPATAVPAGVTMGVPGPATTVPAGGATPAPATVVVVGTTAAPISNNVNITLINATATSANLSVIDASGSSGTIADIVASCQSGDVNGCDSISYSTNPSAAVEAFLYVSGLISGTWYEITVNQSTFDGTANSLHYDDIRFCTEPNPTVLLSKLNDTAVSINVALVGGNFDDATVSFVPSDVGPITFSKSQLPYVVEGLTPLTNYTLTIVFSVGAITNCGTNGPVSANPGDIVYQPASYASVDLAIVAGSITTTSVNITVDGSDGAADISNIVASCSSTHFDCSSVGASVNSPASDPGWLQYSSLQPGGSYQITVETIALNGTAAQVSNSITFCTVPQPLESHFNITKLGDDNYTIALTSEAYNFDNGSVIVYNSSSDLLVEQSFVRADFPIDLYGLTAADQVLTFVFTAAVGSTTDCGVGGEVTSENTTVTVDTSTIKSG
ncbi:uncharacterized protein LOC142348251 [Convolutriloba macropyga]|uniref:uncharacterized protein LOC142348251 n=1 Tax=Convolutriloba macropyga TaxID=536237 RepID=UPI003F51EC0A